MAEGTEGSHHKNGAKKTSKHSMIRIGIDKRKFDVALMRGSQIQAELIPL
jgi:hypothetical protein